MRPRVIAGVQRGALWFILLPRKSWRRTDAVFSGKTSCPAVHLSINHIGPRACLVRHQTIGLSRVRSLRETYNIKCYVCALIIYMQNRPRCCNNRTTTRLLSTYSHTSRKLCQDIAKLCRSYFTKRLAECECKWKMSFTTTMKLQFPRAYSWRSCKFKVVKIAHWKIADFFKRWIWLISKQFD